MTRLIPPTRGGAGATRSLAVIAHTSQFLSSFVSDTRGGRVTRGRAANITPWRPTNGGKPKNYVGVPERFGVRRMCAKSRTKVSFKFEGYPFVACDLQTKNVSVHCTPRESSCQLRHRDLVESRSRHRYRTTSHTWICQKSK
jgi:hypothetical protein